MSHGSFSKGDDSHYKTFAKYQGNGNDFIIFEDFSRADSLEEQWLLENAPRLCNRYHGIGSDGIINLVDQKDYVHMTIINADGTIAKNCGNGLRCAALYIFKSRGTSKASILLYNRVYFCEFRDGEISVKMGECLLVPKENMTFSNELSPVKVAEAYIGNVHRVFFFNEPITDFTVILENFDSATYKDENIGFVFEEAPGRFFSKVYERGVGFTMSCGSGACAAASFLAYLFPEKIKQEAVIIQPGGALKIALQQKGTILDAVAFEVEQTGSAEEVFTGTFHI